VEEKNEEECLKDRAFLTALSDNLREAEYDICEKLESARLVLPRPLSNRTRPRTASHIERMNNPRRKLGLG